MDTSETFVKMCEKAKELQEPLIEPVGEFMIREIHTRLGVGDYVAEWVEDWVNIDEETRKRSIVAKVKILAELDVDCYLGIQPYFNQGNKIWLPRQDQLQEMSVVKGSMGQMVALWNAIDDDVFFDCLGEASWEQLWLAYIMKEKYNKTWNGTEWVNGLE